MLLGLHAMFLKVLGDIVLHSARAASTGWTATALTATIPLALGWFTKLNGSSSDINGAGKAIRFFWSFEFCRILLILTCGLPGSTSLDSAQTIFRADKVWGISAGFPIWFLSAERRQAAWSLLWRPGIGGLLCSVRSAPIVGGAVEVHTVCRGVR